MAEEAFDVKDRKLFDVVHALLQKQTERTEKNTNEELVCGLSIDSHLHMEVHANIALRIVWRRLSKSS